MQGHSIYLQPPPNNGMGSDTSGSRLSGLLGKIGVVTTLLDAVREFRRGRKGSALLLLVAAALSSRVRGVGFVVSAILRLYRRLGRGGSTTR